MPYDYTTERSKLFTEEGTRLLLNTRDTAFTLIDQAGAFRVDKLLRKTPGTFDIWSMLAALDYLVERKELKRLTPPNTAGQDQVFTEASAP